MTDLFFLDTNILIYAYDPTSPAKQAVAREVLRKGIESEKAVVSGQVLGEFFFVSTRRLDPPLTVQEAAGVIDLLTPDLAVVGIDASMVRSAIDLVARYNIAYWDALILAAAIRGGCAKVLTEDLNDGQKYGGVVVENPFTG